MKFNYQAQSKDNQTQTGNLEASSKEEAISILEKHGLYITSLKEENSSIYNKQINLFERISKKDVVLFSRQISIMFKAGVPIVESLRSIAKQTKKSKFKEEINKIGDKVESGGSLSQAFQLCPKLFSPFYIGMIKSGEVSGRLSETLDYLADHQEREFNFNNKIIASLSYPGFIFVVFIGILVLLMTFVIPGLSELFEGKELPLITIIVLGAANFFIRWWWVPVIVIIAGIFLFVRFARTAVGRITIDAILLRIPMVGEFIKKMNMVRISENISTLISGGLPIVQALEVTSGVLNSHTYKKIIDETKSAVRRGDLMSSVLIKYPNFFPALFVQMVTVGEKTGSIDTSLTNVVNFYRADVDRALETMVKMMEPLMIILIGGLVGVVVIAILTPIYQINI